MDPSTWQPGYMSRTGKLERCLLGSQEIQVPESLLEQKHIFHSVMSQETWNKVLTESQRQHLMTFLPKFPEKENEEKRDTLRKLFNGDNFKFGNPLQKFQYQLKDGSYSPDIAKYSRMIQRMKLQEYRNKQNRYYHNLVEDILLSRQRVFDQLTELPPDEPIRFEYNPRKQRRESPLKHRVHRKYNRYLNEVRKECGVDEMSSDEEDGSPVDRSKKQLFKSLNPVPSPEPVTPSVHATYAAKLEFVNGDIDTPPAALKRPRPISPPEITEDTYREMMIKHRKRQLCDDYDEEEHPEYNTQNITLQDVMARCQASRRGGNEPDDDDIDFLTMPPSKGKVKKEKSEKRVRKKAAKKIRDMDIADVASATAAAAAAAGDADDDDDGSRTNVSFDITEDDTSTVDQFPMQSSKKEELCEWGSFFSLLKLMIVNSPDNRISAVKLEEKVRDWQDSVFSDECPWISTHDDWVDLVQSALKFLAGETIGMNVDQFIPYLDYKERAQQWLWIGMGRDSDENLLKWCNHWLKHKGEVSELIIDASQGSPPPARIKTAYVVKTASEEEKADFQHQEDLRFAEPHKAFTYDMHGYQSIVGPVKGVFSKKNDTNRAREHALLVSSRPAFITILTLVRDSVARLPNGEGNRAEICELLKDSQFLAPGITDAQINVVVSGALDRLHSEKDPCVKYDVNSKVWIYLHRNRTEEEFEKIHQAQAAAQKAKKTLAKQKTPKTTTPKPKDMAASHTSSVNSLGLPPSLGSSSESINVEDLSPSQLGSQAQILAGSTAPPAVKVLPRQLQSSISSKTAGVTQSLTPAQLQLLQQAATAQAAHVKAQAEAQAAKAQAQAQAMSKGHVKTPGVSPSKLQQSITVNQQGHLKVIPQTTSITSVVKGTIPPNVTIPTQQELQQMHALRQTSISSSQSEGQGSASPAIQVMTPATKTVTIATSSSVGSPVTVISSSQAATNPLVARLMQQMSAGGQMVSVSSLLAAQRSLQQGNQPRANAAFKLQGGNVLQHVSPGKPVQLAGKPLAHAKGQLLQLGGKGQQTLGVIQTPQGTISIIPQAAGGVMTLSQPKTSGSLELSQSGSPLTTAISQSAVTHGALGQVLSHSKPSTQTGVMVTQLTSGGSITLRPTVAGSHGKVISQGHSGLVPAQLILQQAAGGLKTVETQSGADGTASLLVSSPAGTPQSPNLQMVRTVLSQQAGLKAGQATILISQPALQQGQVLPTGHLVQNVRSQGKTTHQGKPPVFARIINPASNLNMKLAGGVQGFPSRGPLIHTVGPTGQTISVQSDAALRQTLSKLVTGASPGSPANVILTSMGTTGTSISPSQQILAAAAAGKAAQIKEMEKEKKL